MTKEDLLARVWPEVTVTDETLTQTMHELRKALGQDGPALIRTVPHHGYVFEGDPVTTASDGVTLAVVPFVNQSGDPDQQYFAEGLTVDLESALDLIAEIRVLPVRDGVTTARYLLSGGVRTAGDRIRVNARLTDTRTDQVLWNGRFEAAVDHALRASALAPDNARARGHPGVILAFSGEAAASFCEFKSATDLAPMRFDWLRFHHAHAELWAGDLASALHGAKAYRELVPSESWGLFLIGLIHTISGRREAARVAVAQIAVNGMPIRIADVRRSQRHRDPARVERIVAAKRAAGMSD